MDRRPEISRAIEECRGELVADPVEALREHAMALLRAAEPTLHALNDGSWEANAVSVATVCRLIDRAGYVLAMAEEFAV